MKTKENQLGRVSEADQINRGQPRSIALKPSIRLATEARQLAGGGRACLPSRRASCRGVADKCSGYSIYRTQI